MFILEVGCLFESWVLKFLHHFKQSSVAESWLRTLFCHFLVIPGQLPPGKHQKAQPRLRPGISRRTVFLSVTLIYERCWQLGDFSFGPPSFTSPPPTPLGMWHCTRLCIYSRSPWWHSYLYIPSGTARRLAEHLEVSVENWKSFILFNILFV